MKYLPDEQDWTHLDKDWICNVLFTLDESGVQSMIDAAIQKRQALSDLKRNSVVSVRPEVALALKHSV